MTNRNDRNVELHEIAEAIADPLHPLKEDTARWARTALATDDLVERDLTSGFSHQDWTRCAERGLLAVSYTHLTLPTTLCMCRSRWSPDH